MRAVLPLMFAAALAAAHPVMAQAASRPAAPTPPAASRMQIALNSDMRYAFLQGVGSAVGGAFIINNLADAQRDCKPLKICMSTDEIRQEAEVDPQLFARVHSLSALGQAVSIAGAPAKAVVSLEAVYPGIGTIDRVPMLIRVSVFDVAAGAAQTFYADMEFRGMRPVMRAWLTQAMVGDDLRQEFNVPDQ